MSYSARILAAMIQKDLFKKELTYEQFADKIGICRTTVKSLLKGTSNPNLFTIELVTKEIGRSSLILHVDNEILLKLDEQTEHDIREIQTIMAAFLYTESPHFIKFVLENIKNEMIWLRNLYDSANK